jgi:hypothetical protein
MAGQHNFTCDQGATFSRTPRWSTRDETTDPQRSVSDLVTNGTTTVTSATANFTANDVQREIAGTHIPSGAYIASFTNSTTVVISAAATGTGTGGNLTIKSDRRVNLTGYTARLQVRRTKTHPDTLVSLTDASGITLGAAAGTIAILIAAATTTTLPAGVWVYDLELISGAGLVTRLLEGRFQVVGEVTR